MSRTLSIGLGLAMVLGLALPAQAAKTLVYCSEGSPEIFNPTLSTTGTTQDVGLPIYDNLVEFDRGTTKVVPGLAESWTVSDDGLTYTFNLRKGVKFHTTPYFKPTRDFNADDVLFSFNRQWKDDNPYHKVSGGAYDYFNDMAMPALLKSVEKIDDYTVRITLTDVQAPFIANLAMPMMVILSAEYADEMMKKSTPEKVDQQPIGTGPFLFVAYQKDASIRYKAFDDFWGGRSPIDNLVFAITPDAAVRYAKLKAGECHVVPYPNPADIAAMSKDPNITVMQQPGLNIGYVAFNVTKKPVDDVRVRRAMSMAVDKKAIVSAVYQGAGEVAKNPIPPTMWSYNKDIVDYPYDPAKAKALLAEAGYPNGFDIDLWAMPVQRPYNPNAKRMAEMIQSDLAKIGVKAKIVQYEWGEYRKRIQQGEHTFGMMGWTGDNGDPDNFLNVLLGCDAARAGGNNISKWCNKEFNDLVMRAQRTTDIAQRTKLYEQAQVIVNEEAPQIPIAHSIVFMALSPKVVNYKMDTFGLHDFRGVDMKQ